MIYRFEYEGPTGDWESVGTGEGQGAEPVESAFRDLATGADRELPFGRYRYAPADDPAHWRYLEREQDGSAGALPT